MIMDSYYLTVLVPVPHLDEALEALVKDDMTAEWPSLYREYYEHLYPPVPCCKQELQDQKYEPDASYMYDIPTTLTGCRYLSSDLWWAAHNIKDRFSQLKSALEEHFGAVVSDEPYQSYPHCFQECLHENLCAQPTELDKATREERLQDAEKHLRKCEYAAKDVMLRVQDALKMLTRLQARYQDITTWAKEALETNLGNKAPQRLRLLMLEANEWLRTITGACGGFLDDWKEAREDHARCPGFYPDEFMLDDLADIWNARSEKNTKYQMARFPPDASIPLSEQELWRISMQQQMNGR